MNTRSWAAAALLLIGALGAGAAPAKRPARAARLRPTRLIRLNPPGEAPQPPIRISLEPGPVLPSGRQRISVQVTPTVPGRTLDVRTEGEDGLELVGGAQSWRTAPGRRRVESREVILVVRGEGERRLVVRASLVLVNGSRVTATAVYAMSPRKVTPEQEHPGAQQHTRPGGRKVLEIPSG
jgi:hypothetical protein